MNTLDIRINNMKLRKQREKEKLYKAFIIGIVTGSLLTNSLAAIYMIIQ